MWKMLQRMDRSLPYYRYISGALSIAQSANERLAKKLETGRSVPGRRPDTTCVPRVRNAYGTIGYEYKKIHWDSKGVRVRDPIRWRDPLDSTPPPQTGQSERQQSKREGDSRRVL